MPFYEYQCKHCTVFQVEKRAIEDRDILPDCPGCGQRMFRQLSMAAVHFKGQGFYSKDSKREDEF